MELELDLEELLTPFPIFLESPVINPCVKKKKVTKDLL